MSEIEEQDWAPFTDWLQAAGDCVVAVAAGEREVDDETRRLTDRFILATRISRQRQLLRRLQQNDAPAQHFLPIDVLHARLELARLTEEMAALAKADGITVPPGNKI